MVKVYIDTVKDLINTRGSYVSTVAVLKELFPPNTSMFPNSGYPSYEDWDYRFGECLHYYNNLVQNMYLGKYYSYFLDKVRMCPNTPVFVAGNQGIMIYDNLYMALSDIILFDKTLCLCRPNGNSGYLSLVMWGSVSERYAYKIYGLSEKGVNYVKKYGNDFERVKKGLLKNSSYSERIDIDFSIMSLEEFMKRSA